MFVIFTFFNGGVPCAGAFDRGNVRSVIRNFFTRYKMFTFSEK
jgi:hypothetical protein